MGLLSILLLGVGLSLDTFAVSLTLGCFSERITSRQRIRFLVTIGMFHFLMILAGWTFGESISGLIADYDHWIAFVLLGFVGGKMIQEGCSPAKDSAPDLRPAIPSQYAASGFGPQHRCPDLRFQLGAHQGGSPPGIAIQKHFVLRSADRNHRRTDLRHRIAHRPIRFLTSGPESRNLRRYHFDRNRRQNRHRPPQLIPKIRTFDLRINSSPE